MSVVDIGGDRGQPVPVLSVHRLTRHQLGAPQGLVDIQAAEVIINGNRLHGEREEWRGESEGGSKDEGKIHERKGRRVDEGRNRESR